MYIKTLQSLQKESILNVTKKVSLNTSSVSLTNLLIKLSSSLENYYLIFFIRMRILDRGTKTESNRTGGCEN